jgi:assimilatory nitrate reductase catalytic subunit
MPEADCATTGVFEALTPSIHCASGPGIGFAKGPVKAEQIMRKEIPSTCCYCGVGCGVLIQTDGGRIVGISGDPAHPANFGRLCTKGSTLHLTTGLEGRALHPELRLQRNQPRSRVGWDAALAQAARRFADIIHAHGPDAVAFYISGQLLTEDYYVFNKLAKGLIGTNNVDTNSRLCMSSAVSGYKQTLGADAPPACYEDIDHARCIFIAGSNTAYAHPVLFRRIEDARRNRPELKLIVADPRRTDTAVSADLHLPILPGTDVALFHGMLHVMVWDGLVDHAFIRDHTEGFPELKNLLREYTPEAVADICGIRADDVVQAARWFGASKATLSLYCQGLNQSARGTDKNAALINLHLATGQIGKPGAGPFSLTGQPNAMGGREVGGMANLLSAHRELGNPEHRAEVARLWGVESVPDKPGKTAVEMFEAIRCGEIKAVWIACTNPAQSLPHQQHVHEALRKAEFVVVQEAYADTETAAFADLLLPAASWGEREGTMTNSERRITHVRAAVPAPGEARPDWAIAAGFARHLGPLLGRDGARLFPYAQAQDVFNEHRESTRGRDLDITGLSYRILDERGPQQWPFPEGADTGRSRLYEDGRFETASGRAHLVAAAYRPVAEPADARFPLRLTTGRLRDQWHGMSRTGKVARLFSHVEEPVLSMNERDMGRRGLRNDDLVRVKSRRGELVLKVRASDEVSPGQLFLPMHWGAASLSGLGVNALTLDATDPHSKQPELKHAAVQVEKVNLPWRMVALRRGREFVAREAVARFMQQFPFASLTLVGRDEPVLVLDVAAAERPDEQVLRQLDLLLGMGDDGAALSYRDDKRGISKRAWVEEGRIHGIRLTGDTRSVAWLRDVILSGAPIAPLRSWVFAPTATAPPGVKPRGRVVCNCLDVSETNIRAAVERGADLAALQAELKCGTQCGSCVPELRRLLSEGRHPDSESRAA